MNPRIWGAFMVIVSCSGCGFSIAAKSKAELKLLSQLTAVLKIMEWELQYQLLPLPELLRGSVKGIRGPLKDFFLKAASVVDENQFPDVSDCFAHVLAETDNLPGNVPVVLNQLGITLGRFDLPGQVSGIIAAEKLCREQIQLLTEHQDDRLRSYRILGVCAGIALAVLLI